MIDWISWHSHLLNDKVRMRTYKRAIEKAVDPGDVVLDVGTGSGIMAMFACQAGARRVYAVELEDIIHTASRLAEENGFGDKIVFLHKDVTRIKLPEKVDVITSELISDNGPGENMAKLINRCRDRFLKPNGRIVPLRVDMRIAPIQDVAAYRRVSLPGKAAYGIDFTSCEQRLRNLWVRSRSVEQTFFAPGQTLYRYEAHTSSRPDRFTGTLIFNVKKKGTFHGYSSWFDSILAEGVPLTNKPPAELCWSTIFYPLAEPAMVAPGMTIELKFYGRYDLPMMEQNNGTCTWNTTVRKGEKIIVRHKQSLLLADVSLS